MGKIKSFSPSPTFIIFLIFFYILATANINLTPQFLLYDSQRLLQCITLFVIITFTLITQKHYLINNLSHIPNNINIMLLIILALSAISISFSSHSEPAIIEVSLFSLLFLSTLCIKISYTSNPVTFHNIIFISLIALTLTQTVSVLTTYITAITISPEWHPHDLFLNFPNIRFFNQIQSWTLPLIILPFILYNKKFPKFNITLLLIPIFWWLLLFASGSRGTMLSMTVAIFATFLIYKKNSITWLKLQLSTLFYALFLYIILFIFLPSFIHGHYPEGTSVIRSAESPGRIYLWQRAWELAQGNFITGIGPMNLTCDPENNIASHPHNSLIQIATEWGVLVLAIILFIFVYGIYHWVKFSLSQTKNTQPSQNTLHIALFASIICGSTHSLLSGIIVMPLSQTFMVIIIGWMLGIYFKNRPQKKEKSITAYILILFLSLASISSISFALYKKIDDYDHSQKTSLTNSSYYLPRLWSQGKICS